MLTRTSPNWDDGAFLSWGRPAVLVLLILSAIGCQSTHTISRDTPNAYRELTRDLVGKTAHVHLREGRTVKVENLYVGTDSTMGVHPEGGAWAVPTARVRTIEVVNRATGFLRGLGVGAGLPLVLGTIQKDTADGPSEEIGGALTQVLAVPGAVIGGAMGLLREERTTYRFQGAGHAQWSAASAVGDSVDASTKSRDERKGE